MTAWIATHTAAFVIATAMVMAGAAAIALQLLTARMARRLVLATDQMRQQWVRAERFGRERDHWRTLASAPVQGPGAP